MKRRAYACRRDANEPEIVGALGDIGASVLRLNDIDLLVGFRGVNVLLEVKDGAKRPSARKLTPAQTIFRAEWRGQYSVVTSVDEAIRVVVNASLGKRAA